MVIHAEGQYEGEQEQHQSAGSFISVCSFVNHPCCHSFYTRAQLHRWHYSNALHSLSSLPRHFHAPFLHGDSFLRLYTSLAPALAPLALLPVRVLRILVKLVLYG